MIVGGYTRVGPETLAQALGGGEVALAVLDAEAGDRVVESVYLDKAWSALQFLLGGSARDGEQPLRTLFTGGAPFFSNEYGPVAWSMTPQEVQDCAAVLATISPEWVLTRAMAAQFDSSDADPGLSLDRPEDREYISHYYSTLAAAVQRAASAGDALVFSIAA